MTELIEAERTTLVFVNTRKLAERVSARLAQRLGEDAVTAHHGSLSRERRLDAEQRLKEGSLRALVATASLELGIDVGDVDLVIQVGATRSIATFLQRVGRAGHGVGRTPKGRLFPLTQAELLECAAMLRAVRQGDLDRLELPEAPLDILAQQVVASCVAETCPADDLFGRLTRAWPYPRPDPRGVRRDLRPPHRRPPGAAPPRRRGGDDPGHQAGAPPGDHWRRGDPRQRRLPRPGGAGRDSDRHRQRGLRDRVQPGGRVPARHDLVADPQARAGDPAGRLGGRRAADPSVLAGEAPARTAELSRHVADLRAGCPADASAAGWLEDQAGIPPAAAGQLAAWIAEGREALGAVPSQQCLVLERFFDESGGPSSWSTPRSGPA